MRSRVCPLPRPARHHARPEWPACPTEQSACITEVIIIRDRSDHRARPERSSCATGVVIVGGRSGQHGRPEWSAWAAGVNLDALPEWSPLLGVGPSGTRSVGCVGVRAVLPAGRRGRPRVAWPRRSWVRRARGERLLPLGSRDCWDIGGAPVAAGGGYGEAETSTCDGRPWGQVLTDGGIAAVFPLLVAARETYSPVKRPACCPSLVRPPGCGSGTRPWDGLVAVSARRYATLAAGWPEGCFRPGFSVGYDRCQ